MGFIKVISKGDVGASASVFSVSVDIELLVAFLVQLHKDGSVESVLVTPG